MSHPNNVPDRSNSSNTVSSARSSRSRHKIGFRPIGDYLVDAGLLSPAQVEVVLNDQANTSLRFGEILVKRGWVKEKTIEYLYQKIIEPERRAMRQSVAFQKKPPAPPPAGAIAGRHRKNFGPTRLERAPSPIAPARQLTRPSNDHAKQYFVAPDDDLAAGLSHVRPGKDSSNLPNHATSSHHRKGMPSGTLNAHNTSVGSKHPSAAQSTNTDAETTEITKTSTCNGISTDSNYQEVSENLVWIG
jgi:hypothetical protein